MQTTRKPGEALLQKGLYGQISRTKRTGEPLGTLLVRMFHLGQVESGLHGRPAFGWQENQGAKRGG